MTSIRLPSDFEQKLNKIAENENVSKSEIIKEALKKYFENYDKKISPFELGKDLFGKYGSGERNLSKDYKKQVKRKIREKFSH